MNSLEFLRSVLLNGDVDIRDRSSATRLIAMLPKEDLEGARALLNELCTSEREPVELLVVAGRARARLDLREGVDLTVDDLDLANFLTTAAMAYDQEIAEFQAARTRS